MTAASLLQAFSSVLRFAVVAFKVVLVLIIALAAIAYWRWLVGQDEQFQSFKTTLQGAAASNSLTTSFARVDVFRVLDQSGQWHPVNTFGANVDPQRVDLKKFKAFCSRTYDVTVGYPDFRKAVTSGAAAGDFPIAELLSINTIDAADWGSDAAKKCLGRFEGDSVRATVKDALVTDRLWEKHVRNGAQVLVAAGHRVLPECVEGQSCAEKALEKKMLDLFSLDEPRLQLAARCYGEPALAESASCEAARQRAVGTNGARADLPKGEHAQALISSDENSSPAAYTGGGYEGTVVLTMSTLATIGSERRVRLLWVLPLWSKEAFYFRREIAEVTYGSHIGESSLGRSRVPFFGPKLVLRLADADVVGINRRISAQGFSGDLSELERNGRSLSAEANAGILASLQSAVTSHTAVARAMSRAILRDRYESKDVAVEFSQRKVDIHETLFFEEED